jgi:hypothetical protein
VRISYESVTEAAFRTIEILTIRSIDNSIEEAHSWRDMARGAILMWEETVGCAARPLDRARLQLLMDEMPCSGGSTPKIGL